MGSYNRRMSTPQTISRVSPDKESKNTFTGTEELDKKLLQAYSKCSDAEAEFLNFFLGKIHEIYRKYIKNKKKNWNFLLMILQILGTTIIAGCAVLFTAISTESFFKLGDENFLEMFQYLTPQLLICGGILAVFLTVALCFTEYRKHKDYRETWIRHSTLYYRLLLEAEKFLCSPQQPEDRSHFQQTVFVLLESDLLIFERNMQWGKFGDKVFSENFLPHAKK